MLANLSHYSSPPGSPNKVSVTCIIQSRVVSRTESERDALNDKVLKLLKSLHRSAITTPNFDIELNKPKI
ncbi:hypothetical protein IGI04_012367 [Brassica rapa subsp. trilocularis]|uniref:Uncharacterized protein n=1 Tax=Brassica rapa subsp. trilocularis TaxID=1813537 RepID=A0ABQ7N5R2_BRACM|nr:hypothetical protein IGI04_012367 [Brassica rapa subsp. trilocularis]